MVVLWQLLFLCSGSVLSGIEAKPEEETEAGEKAVMENASHKTETQNTEEHPDHALPTTPLRLSRFGMLCFCQLIMIKVVRYLCWFIFMSQIIDPITLFIKG